MLPPTLLFVYNADSGLANSLLDAVHKMVSPRTYACSLCAITYGPLTVRPEWKTFVQTLPQSVRFLYRNEFRAAFPAYAAQPLPGAWLTDAAGQLHQVLTAAEIDNSDLPQLMRLLQQKLAAA